MFYQAAVFLHILSAITWVGGTLFLVIVMVPLSRRETAATGRGLNLLRQAARRFVPVAWASIVVLAATGIYLAWDHWGIRPDNFFASGGHFISTLQAKTGLAVLVIVMSLFHDFLLGPLVVRQLEGPHGPGDGPAPTWGRRLLLVLARVNLFLVLIILYLAVSLTRP
jgi:uncharacterized membrane protein